MNIQPVRVIFRTDADARLGRGHLSRSLALAYVLRETFEIIFISLESSRIYCSLIQKEFHHIFISSDNELANQIQQNDILVLDGYEFNYLKISSIKPLLHKIVVIDDFQIAPSYADMVINHTPGITSKDFTGSKTVRLCLGLDYCLVHPELFKLRQQTKLKMSVNGLLVCFGGADPLDLCEKFVTELINQGFNNPIIAVGRLSKPLTEVKNIKHIQSIDQIGLAHLMISSRISLLSASVLAFEAAVLGCAIFTVYYTKNQIKNYRGLTKLGIAEGGGYIQSAVEITTSVKKLISLYDDEPKLETLRQSTHIQIDGQSSERIFSEFNSMVTRQ